MCFGSSPAHTPSIASREIWGRICSAFAIEAALSYVILTQLATSEGGKRKERKKRPNDDDGKGKKNSNLALFSAANFPGRIFLPSVKHKAKRKSFCGAFRTRLKSLHETIY